MQLVTLIPATKDGNMQGAPTTAPLRGGIKKLFFFTFGQKGVSAKAKKSYQKILTQSKRVLSDFWHNLPIFAEKGGVWAESKKSLSEKTEVVKKGGGGVLIF